MKFGRTRRSSSLVALGATASLALLLAACSGSNGEAGEGGEYTIRLSHIGGESSSQGLTPEKFKEEVETRSDGRVTVEVYPNSQLYGQSDEIEAFESGAVDMLFPAPSQLARLDPRIGALDLPYLVGDGEEFLELTAEDGLLADLLYGNPTLEEHHVQVLGFGDEGPRQLTSNSPVRTPEDLKGMDIRILPSDVFKNTFQTWGANPVVMDFGEVYTGLQQGVIDGQENPYGHIVSQKFYEVQDYLTTTQHFYTAYMLIINTDFMASLPDDLQEIIKESALAAQDYSFNELAPEKRDEALKTIEDAGTTEIIELTDEQRQAFRKEVVPAVWDNNRGTIGDELIDSLIAASE